MLGPAHDLSTFSGAFMHCRQLSFFCLQEPDCSQDICCSSFGCSSSQEGMPVYLVNLSVERRLKMPENLLSIKTTIALDALFNHLKVNISLSPLYCVIASFCDLVIQNYDSLRSHNFCNRWHICNF